MKNYRLLIINGILFGVFLILAESYSDMALLWTLVILIGLLGYLIWKNRKKWIPIKNIFAWSIFVFLDILFLEILQLNGVEIISSGYIGLGGTFALLFYLFFNFAFLSIMLVFNLCKWILSRIQK